MCLLLSLRRLYRIFVNKSMLVVRIPNTELVRHPRHCVLIDLAHWCGPDQILRMLPVLAVDLLIITLWTAMDAPTFIAQHSKVAWTSSWRSLL